MTAQVRSTRTRRVAACCFCLFLLSADSVCAGEPEPQSFSDVYLITMYGVVEKRGNNLDLGGRTEIPGMTRSCQIRCADLTPNAEHLLLAVSRSSGSPLIIIDTRTLETEDNAEVVFPPFHKPWGHYDPLWINAVTSRYVYIADESYTPQPHSFSEVLLDLVEGKAKPLQGLVAGGKALCFVCPLGDRMLVNGSSIRLVDVATGDIVRSIEKVSCGWTKTRTIDIDWDSNTVKLIWTQYVIDQDPVTCKAHINFATGQKIVEEAQAPPEIDLFDRTSKLGKLIVAYGQAQWGESGEFPILDQRLRKALKRIEPMTLDALTFTPDVAYLSPDGRYLFAVKHAVKEITHRNDWKDTSSLVVLDLDTASIAKELEFDDKLVAVLFH